MKSKNLITTLKQHTEKIEQKMMSSEDKRFWNWFFKLEELAEEPLREGERYTIVAKHVVSGEKVTFDNIRLKKMVKNKS